MTDTEQRTRRLVTEAEAVLNRHPNATATDLAVSLPESVVPDENWEHPRSVYSPTAMIRAFLLREVRDYTFAELDHQLIQHQQDAEQLGFCDVPTQATFMHVWRKRLNDETREIIAESATAIRDIAQDHDHTFSDDHDSANRRLF